MTTDPFTAWMRDALAEVEAMTKAAIPEGGTGEWPWRCPHEGMANPPPSHDLCAHLGGCGEEIDLHDDGGHSVEQTRHIAAFDPATVLAMVEADRKILELHKNEATFGGQAVCTLCADWPNRAPYEPPDKEPYPCPTLRIRGAFWARLCPEGYDESWRQE